MKALSLAVVASILAVSCAPAAPQIVLNDVHSRLNLTRVAEYHQPATKAEIVALIRRAGELKQGISISGGRHSMGGQQFGEGTIHLNLAKFNRVLDFDEERGLVTVEAGIQWPALVAWLIDRQKGSARPWGIRQKQTGADEISIGGTLSCNAHGRGLTLKPIVGDVESYELIDAKGKLVKCSRTENDVLFGLAIGGYGLFGVISEVTFRLAPRIKLERKVEIIRADDLAARVAQRVKQGFLYGDFQFKTDEKDPEFLEAGVFSCYRPAPPDAEVKTDRRDLSPAEWEQLYRLAHLDKAKGYRLYADHYLQTDGQVYWSDEHQMSGYIEGQDAVIDQVTKSRAPGTLMITELYVPRSKLNPFLKIAAVRMRQLEANVIYGTVRFIQKDDETFLAWARENYASIVINLRVLHDAAGLELAQRQFQDLIDIALSLGGSYFLTYHRWARRDQVLKAYPQFPGLLEYKLEFDPEERFQSTWYRHYKRMFAN